MVRTQRGLFKEGGGGGGGGGRGEEKEGKGEERERGREKKNGGKKIELVWVVYLPVINYIENGGQNDGHFLPVGVSHLFRGTYYYCHSCGNRLGI